jgi:AGZA family xanthine/uracil permease-like MFS transporter
MAMVAPIGRFFAKTIPQVIQLSTTIGIGLFVVLYGFYDLGIVKQGKYTLLEIGNIDAQVIIGISAIIVTAWGIIVKSKISLLAGLVWGTFLWWTSQRLWPDVWTSVPSLEHDKISSIHDSSSITLIFEMFILNLITCFGLCTALCQLGEILTPQGHVPNGRFLSLIVGLINIFSGIMYGPPFVVSPESSAGIRAGGKTGLSTVVAGIMFLFTLFFGPFFSAIPPAGTAPILVMSGLMLVRNVQSVDFLSKFAVPAYMCIVLIPFTNSIFAGIGVGMACWIAISIVSGQFVGDSKTFYKYYFPDPEVDDDDAGDTRNMASSKGENSDAPCVLQTDIKPVAGTVTTNPIAPVPDSAPTVPESPRTRKASMSQRRQSLAVAVTFGDSEIGAGPETPRFALNH